MSEKMTRASNIPFSIAAGGDLSIPGGFFEFLYLAEVSAGANLRLQGSQVDVPLVVGRRVEFGKPTTEALRLVNNGSGTVSGLLFLGSGEVRDSTVVGTVSVLNGDKSRTDAGIAFWGAQMASAVAANYGIVLFENPVGSGKDFYVNRFLMGYSGSGNSSLMVGVTDDALAVRSDADITASAANTTTALKAKDFSSGALSVIDSYRMSSVSTSLDSMVIVQGFEMSPSVPFEYRYTEPLKIQPGGGIVFLNQTVNRNLRGGIEGFEQ